MTTNRTTTYKKPSGTPVTIRKSVVSTSMSLGRHASIAPGIGVISTAPQTESNTYIRNQLTHEISRQIHTAPSRDLHHQEEVKYQGKWSLESRKATDYDVPASREVLLQMWNKIPAGLEPLTWLRTLSVKYHPDLPAAFDITDPDSYHNLDLQDTNRRYGYDILDDHGHRVFEIVEKVEDTKGKGNNRRYVMVMRSPEGSEILSFRRLDSCVQDGTEVFYSDGSQLGKIVGSCNCYFCASNARVFDFTGKLTLVIEDHGCCSGDFAVVKASDRSKVVAYLSKRYSAGKTGLNDDDLFLLEFKGDKDISPVIKAVLISAVFYFDFKYYESLRAKNTKKTRDKAKKVVRKSRKTLIPGANKIQRNSNSVATISESIPSGQSFSNHEPSAIDIRNS